MRLIRAWVALTPTRPICPAGSRTDPPPSVPSAAVARPAATATPEPLLEPIAAYRGFHGLRGGGQRSSGPGMLQPNSFRLVFPMMTAPALRSLVTTAAS